MWYRVALETILGGRGLSETEGVLAKARKWLELSLEKESGGNRREHWKFIYIYKVFNRIANSLIIITLKIILTDLYLTQAANLTLLTAILLQ